MMRIDIELVKRGIFETRNKAQNEIKNKIIFCNNICITKPSFDVTDTDIIEIKGEKLKYVSRGGLKLEKAIKEFNIDLKNKILIDIGSSTGGFSDVAIQNDIKKIYAIDVGTNQFDKTLRLNNKIFVNYVHYFSIYYFIPMLVQEAFCYSGIFYLFTKFKQ